jgi:hypothetical protein
LEIIDEKIRVSSRVSVVKVSRATTLLLAKPVSTSPKKSRLSFASFRQIPHTHQKILLAQSLIRFDPVGRYRARGALAISTTSVEQSKWLEASVSLSVFPSLIAALLFD